MNFSRVINGILRRLHNQKYRKYGRGHIFDICVDDMKFKLNFKDIPIMDEAIIQRIEGKREPDTIVTLKSILKKDHKVLELGSCDGFFTLIISKCVPEGDIVAVEPDARYFDVLKENINLNNLKNVGAHRVFITNYTPKDNL